MTLGYEPAAQLTPLLLPTAVGIGVVILVMVAAALMPAESESQQPQEVPSERAPATDQDVSWRPSRLRIMFVSVEAGGIVLDGIAERGTEVGTPGSPVTLLFEGRDPCDVSVAVRCLRQWAASDELVEVAMASDQGSTVAALHGGGSVLVLPVLTRSL